MLADVEEEHVVLLPVIGDTEPVELAGPDTRLLTIAEIRRNPRIAGNWAGIA